MSVTTLSTRQAHAPQRTMPAIQISSFGDLVQFANMASKSQLVPKDYVGRPENIMLAVQLGSELGLSPMQSLQNIAVVNGRPTVWGDALPGLCRNSAFCEDIKEYMDGEGDTLTAVCIAKRYNASPVTQKFSVADAKKAGLWSKQGPWTQYPARMLQQRARGFALRDAFPDVLKGLISREEAMDIPPHREPENYGGTTITHSPEALQIDPLPGDSIPSFDPPAKPKPTPMQWFEAKIASLDSRAACYSLLDEGTKAKGLFDKQPASDQKSITGLLAARVEDFLGEPTVDLNADMEESPADPTFPATLAGPGVRVGAKAEVVS